ncbi:hypothetical protein DSECCO2_602030 [anaerobic digester metagenome]
MVNFFVFHFIIGRAVKGKVSICNFGFNFHFNSVFSAKQGLFNLVPFPHEKEVKVRALNHTAVAFSGLMQHEFVKRDLRDSFSVDLLPHILIQFLHRPLLLFSSGYGISCPEPHGAVDNKIDI